MTRALYSWLLRLAFPYVCLRVFWRGLRNRDYWRRIPERFGFIEPLGSTRVIWVHAVSVGEGARGGAAGAGTVRAVSRPPYRADRHDADRFGDRAQSVRRPRDALLRAL